MQTISEAFAQFRRYAWRLEVRDVYKVAQESDALAEFRRTGKVEHWADDDDWAATIRAAHGRGATMGRVRLVGHPVTDYTRWELAAYADNVAAGEEVRILDRTWPTYDPVFDNAPDVWLFDDEVAFEQCYEDDGTYIGPKRVDPTPYLPLRPRAVALSVPVADYQLVD